MRLLVVSLFLCSFHETSAWSLTTFPIRTCQLKSIRSPAPIIKARSVFRSSRPIRMGAWVEVVDAERFEVAIQETTGPLVVDFFATWCGPCVFLAPQLEEVAEQYKGKVRFLKVDTDENEALASTLKIFGLPTLMFLKNGKVLKRIEGALMADKLKSICDFLFFDGPLPADNDVRNLLSEDDLLV